MSDKQFFNNLSSTYAEVRKLDVKKINLKGKNILEYIKENKTVILDERGTKADDELDIWNSYVTTDENGNVIVNGDEKPFTHSISSITSSQSSKLSGASKVINKQVLDSSDNHLMFWQTDGLTDGVWTFYKSTALLAFDSPLTNLTNAKEMFVGCALLNTFASDMPNLIDGEGMFKDCSSLTTFNCDISKLQNGNDFFRHCSTLTTFNENTKSLSTAQAMFEFCYELLSCTANFSCLTSGLGTFGHCTSLKQFNIDMPLLTESCAMFEVCSSLTTFNSNMPRLNDGRSMFYGCSKLSDFKSDLSSLTYATSMFSDCSSLQSFDEDMPKLLTGYTMFASCSQLSSFNSDISSLTNGEYMFSGCSQLSSFASPLCSLMKGSQMFSGCKLDAQSLANIIHFLPTIETNEKITIGLIASNTDAAKQALAEVVQCKNWNEVNNEFSNKNWTVEWQFNGNATTFDFRSPRPSTAVYAKLEEVFIPTDEEIAEAKVKRERIEIPHYQYTSQDGSKLYNISWYHESNVENPEYTLFDSLESAIETLGVIPVEK